MEVITNLDEVKIENKTAIAIGKFDGIHMGHQKIIMALAAKRKEGYKTVIFTFNPSPATLFSGKQIPELTTTEEKRRYFEKMGIIDYLVEFPLTFESAAIEPDVFIRDILVGKLNVGFIAAGDDVSFGNKGMGDYKLLVKEAAIYGYETDFVPKVQFSDGRPISSTYVREAIATGNMAKARKLLGTPYYVSGEITHGKSLGHTIGVPTVNIVPEKSKLLPPNGVYYSYVILEGKTYQGMTNIGYKPTVSDENQMGIETYIYDFDQDIYGKFIEVELLSYRRSEKHFDNLDALISQMQSDIEAGREFFRSYEE
ncbi:bifunctional riboflavin kinase/FAD synthetase [Butyrivibrio sp.]|jgi:riboflavin kinase/FMN adenylyltransferase|uniref:bifunctional riboflavin kinase/FAD synthetase n=1 Tax=Butyrivibrio sp. TaxID=28121 RepID=UPI0025C4E825|nr:bifunctional riboflavin kinase/FAD synthetase [Butyrivibrio sp.]MBQ7430537.1 bifunctional riboflavin kinase/FAD synthetase [Butyrivibrio sp.]MBQ9301801.1 bifunctional riboflavin kinase/FAD synthetase [Butyrivibrio sp.]